MDKFSGDHWRCICLYHDSQYNFAKFVRIIRMLYETKTSTSSSGEFAYSCPRGTALWSRRINEPVVNSTFAGADAMTYDITLWRN